MQSKSSTTTKMEPHSHVPYGELGKGNYANSVEGTFKFLERTCPIVLEQLGKVLQHFKDIDDTFTIADYGTADGGTSMPLLYKCVKKIKEYCGKEKNIHIMYEDQPCNDFLSLFMALNGLLDIKKCPSYFTDFENIFISACGVSFYKQALPPQSVHFAFSSTCMHWLQEKPCNITNGVHHKQITVESERETFKRQAANDWELILLQRAKELKKGGRFVTMQLCTDDNGQYISKYVLPAFSDILKKFVANQIITNDEYHNITFGNYYRTIEELRAPFIDPNTNVSQAGLKLLSCEVIFTPCPYYEDWKQEDSNEKSKESATKYAEGLVGTIRPWSNHTMYSGLSTIRSEEERRSIVDQIYNEYKLLISERPDDHRMDYYHACMAIEKV